MWIGSYTVALGPWDIGIRVDDVQAQQFLLAELGDALHPSESPPPGYAVVTTNAGPKGVGRELPAMRFGHSTVLRSRSPLRLAQALVNHVYSHPAPPPRTLRLRTAAIVHKGNAVLLPDAVIWAAGRERQLDRLGLAPFDSPIVDVDEHAQVELACWSDGEIVRTGPMKISAWMIAEHALNGINLRSRSSVLAAATGLIDPSSTLDPQTALNLLAAQLPVIESFGPEWSIADLAARTG